MKLTKEQLQALYAERNILSNKGIGWDEIFETEIDCIKTLAELHNTMYYDQNPWVKLAYNAHHKGWTLTPKQLVQVKRNAYLVAQLANYDDVTYNYIFEGGN